MCGVVACDVQWPCALWCICVQWLDELSNYSLMYVLWTCHIVQFVYSETFVAKTAHGAFVWSFRFLFVCFLLRWGCCLFWGCFVSSTRNALKLSMQMPRAHHWTSMCTEKLGNSDFATRCRAGTFWKRHFEGCKRHVTHLKLLGASCSHQVFIGEWLLTCV